MADGPPLVTTLTPIEQKDPSIRRGRVDSLTIYEVKEEELRTIEGGSTRSDKFNFAVALFSAGLTLLLSLLTASFPSDSATAIAVAVDCSLGVLGLYFFVSWLRTKDEVRATLTTHAHAPRGLRARPRTQWTSFKSGARGQRHATSLTSSRDCRAGLRQRPNTDLAADMVAAGTSCRIARPAWRRPQRGKAVRPTEPAFIREFRVERAVFSRVRLTAQEVVHGSVSILPN